MEEKILQIVREEMETLRQEILEKFNPEQERNKPMRVKEAAEYIGLSPHTIYQRVCKSAFPHHKSGTTLLFYKNELDAYVRGEWKP